MEVLTPASQAISSHQCSQSKVFKSFSWKNVNLIISHHHPHPHHQESVRVHGNVCILRNNQKMSWDQAKAFCAEVMMMMITLMMAVMVI